MTSWLPEIGERTGPKYLNIADAIAEAVAAGALAPGTKLPPQRNLAYDLGVTLGTVTRAYREAERRGLVGGEVGRGTYVLDPRDRLADGYVTPAEETPGLIDLTHATPVTGRAGECLARTLREIADDPNVDSLVNYQLDTGLPRHLEAGAAWLAQRGIEATCDRIALSCGTQHGILSTLIGLTRAGDTMLVDPLTYPGAIHAARNLGLRLEPVAVDGEGMTPDGVDEAASRTAARFLYCMPALQNPTATHMSEDRRRRVADAARRHGITIIEDDIWGALLNDGIPTMATLAPDISVHVSAPSKSMGGGLRIGYVLAPERMAERIRTGVRSTCWMPAPLMAEVTRRWILDGTANELARHQREDTAARMATMVGHLKRYSPACHPNAHVLWLQLPEPWRAGAFRAEAEERGVRVLTAEVFAAGRQSAPHAVRICVGRARTSDDVDRAGAILAEVLDTPAGAGESVV